MSEQGVRGGVVPEDGVQAQQGVTALSVEERRELNETRSHHDFVVKNRVLALQRGYGIEELLQMSGPEAAGKARSAFKLEPHLVRLVNAGNKERYQFVATPWGESDGEGFSYLVRMIVRRWFIGESAWVGGMLARDVFPKIEPLPPKPRGWSEDAELRKLYGRNEPEDYVPLDAQRSPAVTGFPVIMSANHWDRRRQDICQSFLIDPVYGPLLAGEDNGALRYVGQRCDPGIDVSLVDLFYGWEPWVRNARMKTLNALEVNGIGDIYGQKVALAGPEILALLATDPGFRFRLGTSDFPDMLLSAYRITVDGKEAIPTVRRRLNRLELGYYFFGHDAQTAHLSAPKVIL